MLLYKCPLPRGRISSFQLLEWQVLGSTQVITESCAGALGGGEWQCQALGKGQTRLIISHDPIWSGMADRKAVIIVICCLLLSLKLKFRNVTEERAIVRSSAETCLC